MEHRHGVGSIGDRGSYALLGVSTALLAFIDFPFTPGRWLKGLLCPSATGEPASSLRRLMCKELVDNGLDAADAAGRLGQVTIERHGSNT